MNTNELKKEITTNTDNTARGELSHDITALLAGGFCLPIEYRRFIFPHTHDHTLLYRALCAARVARWTYNGYATAAPIGCIEVAKKEGEPKDARTFPELLSDFSTLYTAGADCTEELQAIARALTYSVLKKISDPQRKDAPTKERVSDSGFNPVLLGLRRGVAHDRNALEGAIETTNNAYYTDRTSEGEITTKSVGRAAADLSAKICGETLTDASDLVQTACMEMIVQAKKSLDMFGKVDLETPYTITRLSKRVYIKRADSAAYTDVETTGISEVFRAVRRAVMDARAVSVDPRNKFQYIEDITAEGLEQIYIRMGKYTGISDKETAEKYEGIVEGMGLTARQTEVLELRMKGYGYKAIATYLGVSQRAIAKTCTQIAKKAEKFIDIKEGEKYKEK